MGWLSKIIGGEVVDAASGIAGIIDKFVETPDEKAAAEILKLKLLQRPAELQIELNKIEAGHRSIFVAGWRPGIGWVCMIGLGFTYLINPMLQWYTGDPGPVLPLDHIEELVYAMLGFGAMRTFEKIGGKAK